MQTRHLPRQDGMCGGSGERGRALKRQGDSMQGSYSCTSARRSGIYSSNALISTLTLGTTTRPQSPLATPLQQHFPPNLTSAGECPLFPVCPSPPFKFPGLVPSTNDGLSGCFLSSFRTSPPMCGDFEPLPELPSVFPADTGQIDNAHFTAVAPGSPWECL